MFATLVGPYPATALRDVLLDQLEAGLELLTDGELAAADPVVAALDVLDGVTAGGPAPSLGTAWAGARPMVQALPAWGRPALVDRWLAADAMARTLAAERHDGVRPVRAGLLGPYTLGRIAHRGRFGRRRVTLAFAEALGVELAGLYAAGAPLVQVDEPALVTLEGDSRTERALAAEAWRRLAAAAADLHLSLGVMHGSAEGAGADLLFEGPFRSYFFDLCAGPDNWRLISRAPADRGIVAGVADAQAARLDSREILVWGARYAAALGGRGLERVGIAPSAGLAGLTRAQAQAKIRSLADAARLAGLTDVEELRRSIDPRAIDARSAALGRYEPGQGSIVEGPLPPRRRRRPAGR